MLKQSALRVPESTILTQILTYLNYRGIVAYRINSGMIRTEKGNMVKLAPAGFSDIFAVLKGGRACFIECKAQGNKTTLRQDKFLEKMKAQGAVAFVAYSVEEVISQLKENA